MVILRSSLTLGSENEIFITRTFPMICKFLWFILSYCFNICIDILHSSEYREHIYGVKSVQNRIFPYLVWMWEYTDQKSSVFGHKLRSVYFVSQTYPVAGESNYYNGNQLLSLKTLCWCIFIKNIKCFLSNRFFFSFWVVEFWMYFEA